VPHASLLSPISERSEMSFEAEDEDAFAREVGGSQLYVPHGTQELTNQDLETASAQHPSSTTSNNSEAGVHSSDRSVPGGQETNSAQASASAGTSPGASSPSTTDMVPRSEYLALIQTQEMRNAQVLEILEHNRQVIASQESQISSLQESLQQAQAEARDYAAQLQALNAAAVAAAAAEGEAGMASQGETARVDYSTIVALQNELTQTRAQLISTKEAHAMALTRAERAEITVAELKVALEESRRSEEVLRQRTAELEEQLREAEERSKTIRGSLIDTLERQLAEAQQVIAMQDEQLAALLRDEDMKPAISAAISFERELERERATSGGSTTAPVTDEKTEAKSSDDGAMRAVRNRLSLLTAELRHERQALITVRQQLEEAKLDLKRKDDTIARLRGTLAARSTQSTPAVSAPSSSVQSQLTKPQESEDKVDGQLAERERELSRLRLEVSKLRRALDVATTASKKDAEEAAARIRQLEAEVSKFSSLAASNEATAKRLAMRLDRLHKEHPEIDIDGVSMHQQRKSEKKQPARSGVERDDSSRKTPQGDSESVPIDESDSMSSVLLAFQEREQAALDLLARERQRFAEALKERDEKYAQAVEDMRQALLSMNTFVAAEAGHVEEVNKSKVDQSIKHEKPPQVSYPEHSALGAEIVADQVTHASSTPEDSPDKDQHYDKEANFTPIVLNHHLLVRGMQVQLDAARLKAARLQKALADAVRKHMMDVAKYEGELVKLQSKLSHREIPAQVQAAYGEWNEYERADAAYLIRELMQKAEIMERTITSLSARSNLHAELANARKELIDVAKRAALLEDELRQSRQAEKLLGERFSALLQTAAPAAAVYNTLLEIETVTTEEIGKDANPTSASPEAKESEDKAFSVKVLSALTTLKRKLASVPSDQYVPLNVVERVFASLAADAVLARIDAAATEATARAREAAERVSATEKELTLQQEALVLAAEAQLRKQIDQLADSNSEKSGEATSASASASSSLPATEALSAETISTPAQLRAHHAKILAQQRLLAQLATEKAQLRMSLNVYEGKLNATQRELEDIRVQFREHANNASLERDRSAQALSQLKEQHAREVKKLSEAQQNAEASEVKWKTSWEQAKSRAATLEQELRAMRAAVLASESRSKEAHRALEAEIDRLNREIEEERERVRTLEGIVEERGRQVQMLSDALKQVSEGGVPDGSVVGEPGHSTDSVKLVDAVHVASKATKRSSLPKKQPTDPDSTDDTSLDLISQSEVVDFFSSDESETSEGSQYGTSGEGDESSDNEEKSDDEAKTESDVDSEDERPHPLTTHASTTRVPTRRKSASEGHPTRPPPRPLPDPQESSGRTSTTESLRGNLHVHVPSLQQITDAPAERILAQMQHVSYHPPATTARTVQLSAALALAKAESSALEHRVTGLVKSLSLAQQRETKLNETIANLEAELRLAQMTAAKATASAESSEAQVDAFKKDIERLENELVESQRLLESHQAELEQARGLAKAHESAVKRMREEFQNQASRQQRLAGEALDSVVTRYSENGTLIEQARASLASAIGASTEKSGDRVKLQSDDILCGRSLELALERLCNQLSEVFHQAPSIDKEEVQVALAELAPAIISKLSGIIRANEAATVRSALAVLALKEREAFLERELARLSADYAVLAGEEELMARKAVKLELVLSRQTRLAGSHITALKNWVGEQVSTLRCGFEHLKQQLRAAQIMLLQADARAEAASTALANKSLELSNTQSQIQLQLFAARSEGRKEAEASYVGTQSGADFMVGTIAKQVAGEIREEVMPFIQAAATSRGYHTPSVSAVSEELAVALAVSRCIAVDLRNRLEHVEEENDALLAQLGAKNAAIIQAYSALQRSESVLRNFVRCAPSALKRIQMRMRKGAPGHFEGESQPAKSVSDDSASGLALDLSSTLDGDTAASIASPDDASRAADSKPAILGVISGLDSEASVEEARAALDDFCIEATRRLHALTLAISSPLDDSLEQDTEVELWRRPRSSTPREYDSTDLAGSLIPPRVAHILSLPGYASSEREVPAAAVGGDLVHSIRDLRHELQREFEQRIQLVAASAQQEISALRNDLQLGALAAATNWSLMPRDQRKSGTDSAPDETPQPMLSERMIEWLRLSTQLQEQTLARLRRSTMSPAKRAQEELALQRWYERDVRSQVLELSAALARMELTAAEQERRAQRAERAVDQLQTALLRLEKEAFGGPSNRSFAVGGENQQGSGSISPAAFNSTYAELVKLYRRSVQSEADAWAQSAVLAQQVTVARNIITAREKRIVELKKQHKNQLILLSKRLQPLTSGARSGAPQQMLVHQQQVQAAIRAALDLADAPEPMASLSDLEREGAEAAAEKSLRQLLSRVLFNTDKEMPPKAGATQSPQDDQHWSQTVTSTDLEHTKSHLRTADVSALHISILPDDSTTALASEDKSQGEVRQSTSASSGWLPEKGPNVLPASSQPRPYSGFNRSIHQVYPSLETNKVKGQSAWQPEPLEMYAVRGFTTFGAHRVIDAWFTSICNRGATSQASSIDSAFTLVQLQQALLIGGQVLARAEGEMMFAYDRLAHERAQTLRLCAILHADALRRRREHFITPGVPAAPVQPESDEAQAGASLFQELDAVYRTIFRKGSRKQVAAESSMSPLAHAVGSGPAVKVYPQLGQQRQDDEEYEAMEAADETAQRSLVEGWEQQRAIITALRLAVTSLARLRGVVVIEHAPEGQKDPTLRRMVLRPRVPSTPAEEELARDVEPLSVAVARLSDELKEAIAARQTASDLVKAREQAIAELTTALELQKAVAQSQASEIAQLKAKLVEEDNQTQGVVDEDTPPPATATTDSQRMPKTQESPEVMELRSEIAYLRAMIEAARDQKQASSTAVQQAERITRSEETKFDTPRPSRKRSASASMLRPDTSTPSPGSTSASSPATRTRMSTPSGRPSTPPPRREPDATKRTPVRGNGASPVAFAGVSPSSSSESQTSAEVRVHRKLHREALAECSRLRRALEAREAEAAKLSAEVAVLRAAQPRGNDSGSKACNDSSHAQGTNLTSTMASEDVDELRFTAKKLEQQCSHLRQALEAAVQRNRYLARLEASKASLLRRVEALRIRATSILSLTPGQETLDPDQQLHEKLKGLEEKLVTLLETDVNEILTEAALLESLELKLASSASTDEKASGGRSTTDDVKPVGPNINIQVQGGSSEAHGGVSTVGHLPAPSDENLREKLIARESELVVLQSKLSGLVTKCEALEEQLKTQERLYQDQIKQITSSQPRPLISSVEHPSQTSGSVQTQGSDALSAALNEAQAANESLMKAKLAWQNKALALQLRVRQLEAWQQHVRDAKLIDENSLLDTFKSPPAVAEFHAAVSPEPVSSAPHEGQGTAQERSDPGPGASSRQSPTPHPAPAVTKPPADLAAATIAKQNIELKSLREAHGRLVQESDMWKTMYRNLQAKYLVILEHGVKASVARKMAATAAPAFENHPGLRATRYSGVSQLTKATKKFLLEKPPRVPKRPVGNEAKSAKQDAMPEVDDFDVANLRLEYLVTEILTDIEGADPNVVIHPDRQASTIRSGADADPLEASFSLAAAKLEAMLDHIGGTGSSTVQESSSTTAGVNNTSVHLDEISSVRATSANLNSSVDHASSYGNGSDAEDLESSSGLQRLPDADSSGLDLSLAGQELRRSQLAIAHGRLRSAKQTIARLQAELAQAQSRVQMDSFTAKVRNIPIDAKLLAGLPQVAHLDVSIGTSTSEAAPGVALLTVTEIEDIVAGLKREVESLRTASAHEYSAPDQENDRMKLPKAIPSMFEELTRHRIVPPPRLAPLTSSAESEEPPQETLSSAASALPPVPSDSEVSQSLQQKYCAVLEQLRSLERDYAICKRKLQESESKGGGEGELNVHESDEWHGLRDALLELMSYTKPQETGDPTIIVKCIHEQIVRINEQLSASPLLNRLSNGNLAFVRALLQVLTAASKALGLAEQYQEPSSAAASPEATGEENRDPEARSALTQQIEYLIAQQTTLQNALNKALEQLRSVRESYAQALETGLITDANGPMNSTGLNSLWHACPSLEAANALQSQEAEDESEHETKTRDEFVSVCLESARKSLDGARSLAIELWKARKNLNQALSENATSTLQLQNLLKRHIALLEVTRKAQPAVESKPMSFAESRRKLYVHLNLPVADEAEKKNESNAADDSEPQLYPPVARLAAELPTNLASWSAAVDAVLGPVPRSRDDLTRDELLQLCMLQRRHLIAAEGALRASRQEFNILDTRMHSALECLADARARIRQLEESEGGHGGRVVKQDEISSVDQEPTLTTQVESTSKAELMARLNVIEAAYEALKSKYRSLLASQLPGEQQSRGGGGYDGGSASQVRESFAKALLSVPPSLKESPGGSYTAMQTEWLVRTNEALRQLYLSTLEGEDQAIIFQINELREHHSKEKAEWESRLSAVQIQLSQASKQNELVHSELTATRNELSRNRTVLNALTRAVQRLLPYYKAVRGLVPEVQAAAELMRATLGGANVQSEYDIACVETTSGESGEGDDLERLEALNARADSAVAALHPFTSPGGQLGLTAGQIESCAEKCVAAFTSKAMSGALGSSLRQSLSQLARADLGPVVQRFTRAADQSIYSSMPSTLPAEHDFITPESVLAELESLRVPELNELTNHQDGLVPSFAKAPPVLHEVLAKSHATSVADTLAFAVFLTHSLDLALADKERYTRAFRLSDEARQLAVNLARRCDRARAVAQLEARAAASVADRCTAELNSLQNQLADAVAARDECQATVDELNGALLALRDEYGRLQARFEALTRDKELADQECAKQRELEQQLQECAESLRVASNDRDALARELAQSVETIQTLTAELKDATAQRAACQSELIELRHLLGTSVKEIGQNLATAAQLRDAARERVQALTSAMVRRFTIALVASMNESRKWCDKYMSLLSDAVSGRLKPGHLSSELAKLQHANLFAGESSTKQRALGLFSHSMNGGPAWLATHAVRSQTSASLSRQLFTRAPLSSVASARRRADRELAGALAQLLVSAAQRDCKFIMSSIHAARVDAIGHNKGDSDAPLVSSAYAGRVGKTKLSLKKSKKVVFKSLKRPRAQTRALNVARALEPSLAMWTAVAANPSDVDRQSDEETTEEELEMDLAAGATADEVKTTQALLTDQEGPSDSTTAGTFEDSEDTSLAKHWMLTVPRAELLARLELFASQLQAANETLVASQTELAAAKDELAAHLALISELREENTTLKKERRTTAPPGTNSTTQGSSAAPRTASSSAEEVAATNAKQVKDEEASAQGAAARENKALVRRLATISQQLTGMRSAHDTLKEQLAQKESELKRLQDSQKRLNLLMKAKDQEIANLTASTAVASTAPASSTTDRDEQSNSVAEHKELVEARHEIQRKTQLAQGLRTKIQTLETQLQVAQESREGLEREVARLKAQISEDKKQAQRSTALLKRLNTMQHEKEALESKMEDYEKTIISRDEQISSANSRIKELVAVARRCKHRLGLYESTYGPLPWTFVGDVPSDWQDDEETERSSQTVLDPKSMGFLAALAPGGAERGELPPFLTGPDSLQGLIAEVGGSAARRTAILPQQLKALSRVMTLLDSLPQPVGVLHLPGNVFEALLGQRSIPFTTGAINSPHGTMASGGYIVCPTSVLANIPREWIAYVRAECIAIDEARNRLRQLRHALVLVDEGATQRDERADAVLRQMRLLMSESRVRRGQDNEPQDETTYEADASDVSLYALSMLSEDMKTNPKAAHANQSELLNLVRGLKEAVEEADRATSQRPSASAASKPSKRKEKAQMSWVETFLPSFVQALRKFAIIIHIDDEKQALEHLAPQKLSLTQAPERVAADAVIANKPLSVALSESRSARAAEDRKADPTKWLEPTADGETAFILDLANPELYQMVRKAFESLLSERLRLSVLLRDAERIQQGSFVPLPSTLMGIAQKVYCEALGKTLPPGGEENVETRSVLELLPHSRAKRTEQPSSQAKKEDGSVLDPQALMSQLEQYEKMVQGIKAQLLAQRAAFAEEKKQSAAIIRQLRMQLENLTAHHQQMSVAHYEHLRAVVDEELADHSAHSDAEPHSPGNSDIDTSVHP